MNLQETKSWVFSHKILSAVIAFFSLVIIYSVLTPVTPKDQTVAEVKVTTEQKVVFDIPKLFNKNIVEVTQILGTPENYPEPTAEQIKLGTKTWEKTFKKDGFELLVTYEIGSKKITDFFISATDEIYESKDRARMLKLTNTEVNNTTYSVEFVKALKDPSKFTGILIKQN